MRQETEKYPRYDRAEYFSFGPSNRDEYRRFIKKMETAGVGYAELPPEIYRALADAEVLQVHIAPVPKKVFDIARKLKVVISNRGGTENIDIDAAVEKGVAVLCNPAHNANAVAEMTVGLIIAETRNIARNNISLVRDHKWYEFPPNAGNIHELCSMTVGLVGYGVIGRLVAGLLLAFRSRVLVFDPYITPQMIDNQHVSFVSTLDELLEQSDIVSLHARVTGQTKGLIGMNEFRKMKKNAVLINTARPALLDMDILYTALKERWITGAALDVYPEEPLPSDSPLLELDNITLTCHKGGDTVESYRDSPKMVLRQAEEFFNNRNPRFWVNQEQLKNFHRALA
jgi:D-3-phosphoglycerate dehydrogenase